MGGVSITEIVDEIYAIFCSIQEDYWSRPAHAIDPTITNKGKDGTPHYSSLFSSQGAHSLQHPRTGDLWAGEETNLLPGREIVTSLLHWRKVKVQKT